ncbi:MAG: GntR family transcriptional regulator [Nocardioides sp.]|nr:GntR family transcriptional regulator [Nocardioides sp.]
MNGFDGRVTRGSRVSLQDQILRALVRKIEDGTYGPGDRLPTERQIAQSMGVSLAPVRVAMKQLERAGHVERSQGRGTFVVERPVHYELRLMSSSTDSLRRAGVPFAVEVVDQSIDVPPSEVATRLGLDGDETAFHLLRVVTVRACPSILLESWVSQERMGDVLDDEIFDRGESLYRVLAKNGVTQRRASGQVAIHYATESEADLLGMAFGTPLLGLTSVSFDADDRPIDYSRGLYDSGRFSLEMDRAATHETED